MEVEYSDSETPIITTRNKGQRPHSIAGHPTTPGDKDELWWDEDFEDIPLTSTEPDSADAHIEEILSDPQDDEYQDSQEQGEFIEDGQFEDIDGYHAHYKPQEISQADTDEWEDCETEEYYGTQESGDSAVVSNKGSKSPNAHHSLSPDDALRLSISAANAAKFLNPDAPIFTPGLSPTSPMSPEIMKTPDGHVKIQNWAEEMKSPVTSPENKSISASPVSNEASPKSKKGTKNEGTSQDLPRRLENELVSPEKKEVEKKKDDETVENKSTSKTTEETAKSNECREKSAKDNGAEHSEVVNSEITEESVKSPIEEPTEKVESDSGKVTANSDKESKAEKIEETAEAEVVESKAEKVEVTAESGESKAEKVEVTAEAEESKAEKVEVTAEAEENEQMAKTDDTETGRSQDPTEKESTTQEAEKKAEGKIEGSSQQNDNAPEEKGNFKSKL